MLYRCTIGVLGIFHVRIKVEFGKHHLRKVCYLREFLVFQILKINRRKFDLFSGEFGICFWGNIFQPWLVVSSNFIPLWEWTWCYSMSLHTASVSPCLSVIVRIFSDNLTKTRAFQFCLTWNTQWHQFNSIQFNSIQFSSIQFNSIQFNSIQFNSIHLFSSVTWYIK